MEVSGKTDGKVDRVAVRERTILTDDRLDLVLEALDEYVNNTHKNTANWATALQARANHAKLEKVMRVRAKLSR